MQSCKVNHYLESLKSLEEIHQKYIKSPAFSSLPMSIKNHNYLISDKRKLAIEREIKKGEKHNVTVIASGITHL